jgi:type VI secretion system FHA domain protein
VATPGIRRLALDDGSTVMTLTLSILRCPEGVPPETRRLTGGDLSIGRGPRNDWVLPDPERVLSKQHCVVTFTNNVWQVMDTSANGTFLNQDVDRLTPAEPRPLRNGDRLLLGSYEIEAAIDQDARAGTQASYPAGASGSGGSFADERLTSDPFPPLENDPLGISMPPVALPPEFSQTTPDAVAAVEGHFRPPRPNVALLPEDWDIDPPGPAAAPESQAAPGWTLSQAPAAPPAAASPAPPPVPPPPMPLMAPASAAPAAFQAAAPQAMAPMEPVSSHADAAGGDVAAQGFAAFAFGAGITTPAPADPLAALQGLGRAFRAVVSGLRRTMIARAAVKGEFRIDQTVIQESGNNPLKFSADDDDALAALLGTGRRTDMTAERAVGEAMRDIRLHELAVATAMQQAVRDMLAGLAPAKAERRADKRALDVLPWRAAARRWQAYEALHRETVQGMTDDFDRVFGTSFMRAYERAMSELSAQQSE